MALMSGFLDAANNFYTKFHVDINIRFRSHNKFCVYAETFLAPINLYICGVKDFVYDGFDQKF